MNLARSFYEIILCYVFVPFIFCSFTVRFAGCAYYSTSVGMIGGIQEIGIPVAESLTAEFVIAERLSERAVELYDQDGRLRVVDQGGADAILYLTVLSITDEPFTYSASEQTEQFRLSMKINGKLISVGSEQTLKEFDSIEGWATYVSGSNQDESRDQAIDKSIDMVVQELIDTSTSSW
ncbi:MAG: hypothetical protein VX294_05095 [Candidatus Latescibacterota bacterium]|nr:hypothetical protein [Candidatus Latescibacterota bacterium]